MKIASLTFPNLLSCVSAKSTLATLEGEHRTLLALVLFEWTNKPCCMSSTEVLESMHDMNPNGTCGTGCLYCLLRGLSLTLMSTMSTCTYTFSCTDVFNQCDKDPFRCFPEKARSTLQIVGSPLVQRCFILSLFRRHFSVTYSFCSNPCQPEPCVSRPSVLQFNALTVLKTLVANIAQTCISCNRLFLD